MALAMEDKEGHCFFFFLVSAGLHFGEGMWVKLNFSVS